MFLMTSNDLPLTIDHPIILTLEFLGMGMDPEYITAVQYISQPKLPNCASKATKLVLINN